MQRGERIGWAGAPSGAGQVRSINHDPRYHELAYLSTAIIVLVFGDLAYLFERFCKQKKTKG
jgi:hypothetical protein